MKTGMRLLVASLLVLGAIPAWPFSARVEGNISLVAQSGGSLSSYSWAQYYDSLGFKHDIYIAGTHTIAGVDTLQWATYTGSYAGTRQGPWQCGNSYDASNSAQAHPNGPAVDWHVAGGPWTATTSAPACPPPPPTDPADRCDGQSGFGQPCSPIIINVANSSYELSGTDDPVWFDIDDDGISQPITWVGRESGVAFLGLDRNGNGVIDSGAELFGNVTRMSSGLRAPNGFEALKELDVNRDGLVTGDDDAWAQLVLWHDTNHDGVCERSEIMPLAATAVTQLSTKYHWTGRRDAHGNLFAFHSVAALNSGKRVSYYDVFFRSCD